MATGYIPARLERAGADRRSASEAVDDLIKFRLVESLLRQPDRPATPAELAARLGFHSVDVTAMALDELAGDGLLVTNRRPDALSYAVPVDPPLRAEMAELVAAGPPGLFNRLAAASVVRIRRLLRKRG